MQIPYLRFLVRLESITDCPPMCPICIIAGVQVKQRPRHYYPHLSLLPWGYVYTILSLFLASNLYAGVRSGQHARLDFLHYSILVVSRSAELVDRWLR